MRSRTQIQAGLSVAIRSTETDSVHHYDKFSLSFKQRPPNVDAVPVHCAREEDGEGNRICFRKVTCMVSEERGLQAASLESLLGGSWPCQGMERCPHHEKEPSSPAVGVAVLKTIW